MTSIHEGTDPAVRLAEIPRSAWRAASVMALGGFLGNMDGSIVAVGLRTMQTDLGVGLPEIQWVATAFLLGLSAALPLTPWLVRRLGGGRLWLWLMAGFVITSVLCALAPSVGVLVAARALQGATAGILITAGQTVIGQVVGPARLGRMMARLGLVVGLAPIAGPSVGGFLLHWFGWPALFWVNLPVGGLALLLGARYVPRGQRAEPPPMDWPGLVLVSVGIPVLVYGLAELGVAGGPVLVPVVLAGIGVGLAAAFVIRALRHPHPAVSVRLVGRPVMGSALATVLLAGAGMFGTALLLPLWFQLRFGEGTAATGLLMVPLSLGTLLIMLVAGRLVDSLGGGTVALIGTSVVLLTTVPLFWLAAGAPMVLVQAVLFARGVGLGLSMMPAMTAAYASVSAEELGDATALANIAMRVGGALGGALSVIVLSAGLAAGGPAAGNTVTGFLGAFAVLGVTAVLAVVAACWLRRAEPVQRVNVGGAGEDR